MTIATTVSDYLNRKGVHYDTLQHPPTATTLQTARSAHIASHCLAKSVILEDESGYVMAVIPASHRLQIGKLDRLLHRKLGLATETELAELFDDCELGAIPALGPAYHVQTVIDDALAEIPDIYFEGGDHRALIRMRRGEFQSLMQDMRHGRFSKPI